MPLKIGKTTELVQSILVGSVIPPGTIAPFGGGAVPQGWLLCDGSTVNRSLYPALFEAVGTVHGEGDGSTTFHLPDYRGRFLRGADNMGTGAAGRDPDAETRTASNAGGATGNGVGSVQDSDNKSHQHSQNSNTVLWAVGTTNRGNPGASGSNLRTDTSDSYKTQLTGGNESRPQNANVSWVIKV